MVRLASRDRDSRSCSTDSKKTSDGRRRGSRAEGHLIDRGSDQKAIYKKAKKQKPRSSEVQAGYSREIEIVCFREEALNRLLYVY